MRHEEEGVNVAVGTWVLEFTVVSAVRVSDLNFVAVQRSLNEAKEGDCEK